VLPNVSIDEVREPAQSDVHEVIRGLVAFNERHAPPEDWLRLAAFVRDSDGHILGGVIGETHWNWLCVSHLWLSDELRGRGLGRELMASIEHGASEHGCDMVQLDTYDFQALPFYEHLGFEEFGELPNSPSGHARHFLWKRL